MATLPADSFDLDAIARSGQTFTWRRLGDEDYLVASGDRLCRARQTGGELEILGSEDGGEPSGPDLEYWRGYFALDQDYDAILEELALPSEVLRASRGIRVLDQDWWDTSVCFIISQNSNIARIQRTVDALLEAGGATLPRPERMSGLLADEAFRDDLRLGYRAPYLAAFAERCTGGWSPVAASRHVPLEEAMADLECCQGIGPKVAQCICLFSLGYLEAVPRDTWIKRAEREHDITWHPRWGGIQQQFVFNWMRTAT